MLAAVKLAVVALCYFAGYNFNLLRCTDGLALSYEVQTNLDCLIIHQTLQGVSQKSEPLRSF